MTYVATYVAGHMLHWQCPSVQHVNKHLNLSPLPALQWDSGELVATYLQHHLELVSRQQGKLSRNAEVRQVH